MSGPTLSELHLQVQNRLIEELSAKHSEFQTHIDLLEEVVLRCDSRGRLALLNPSWTRITGWALSDSLGRSLTSFVAQRASCEHLLELLKGNEPISTELKLCTRFGETRIFTFRARRRGDWYGSLHDVTELRHAVDALRESEKQARKLSAVASRTDNLVVITDAEGRIDWVNESFERGTGFRLGEVRGYSPGQLLQGKDTAPETVAEMARGVESGTGFAVEILNYTKSGEPYWVAIDCSPVCDADGQVLNFVAIQREISERKRAEADLRESERRYRHVLNSVSEPIFRCDGTLRLRFANPAWERFTGAVIGGDAEHSLESFVHPQDVTLLRAAGRQAVIAEGPVRQELRVLHALGEWRRVELMLSRTDIARDAESPGVTGALVDVEERWRNTQAILQAKQEAEELSRARTRFVANMSHEIRTPLNAIIGMTSVLENTTLSNEQQLCIETIRNGGKVLCALVNDVLDFAKLDSGEIEIEDTEFGWADLFEEAVDMVGPDVEAKGLKLNLTCSSPLPQRLHGDVHRTRQILLNLLSNAVKFTERGGIDIDVRWRVLGAETGRLEVEVRDSGVGIPADRVGKLFDAFTQADPSVTRRFGGTGLGLAICHQLCERLGGHISAQSEPGVGTTLRFSVPFRAPAQAQRTRPAPRLVAVNLERCTTSVVESLATVLGGRLLEERGPGLPPGLRIEEDTGVSRWLDLTNPPAILTPCRLQRASTAPTSATGTAAAEHRTPRAMRILVAEDVIANQVVIRAMLKQLGYTDVVIVDDGLQVLNSLARRSADVVLLDIHMPIMDGLTAAAEIRRMGGVQQPCILALSADATTDARAAADEAGFDAWLTKPITRDVLAQALERIEDADQRLAAG